MVVKKGAGLPPAPVSAPLRPSGQPTRKASSSKLKEQATKPSLSTAKPSASGSAATPAPSLPPANNGRSSPIVGKAGPSGTQGLKPTAQPLSSLAGHEPGGSSARLAAPANRRPPAKQPSFGSLAGPKGKEVKGPIWGSSSSKASGSKPSSADSSGGERFRKLDMEGTERAIQETFKKGQRKDVSSMCRNIDKLLDNPLHITDEDRACLVIQRHARGFLVRNRRAAGLLYPVEQQALVDGKVLLKHYGATVFGFSPRTRRDWVVKHFAACLIQRVAKKRLKLGKPKNKTFGLMQHAAALVLQRVARGHRARSQCQKRRLRFSKAARFLSFLATDLKGAAHKHTAQVQAAASTRLQAWWRGLSSRKLSAAERVKEEKAAVQVQSLVRGWSTRKLTDKIHERIVLKRIIRMWNKIMWTGASPLRYLERHPEEKPSEVAAAEGANDSLGMIVRVQEDHDDLDGIRRSLYLGDDEDDVVFLGEHQAADGQPEPEPEPEPETEQVTEAEAHQEQLSSTADEVRSSWQVVMSENAAPIAAAAPPEWPEEYKGSTICLEVDAILQAMKEDMNALRIQQVFRGHACRRQNQRMARLRCSKSQQPEHESQILTPMRVGKIKPAGLPPTPCRPPSGLAAAPHVSSPPCSAPSGPSPTPPRMSPGTPGSSRGRHGLQEWKSAMIQQVNSINEQLVESARKHRSRSRSPQPDRSPSADRRGLGCDSPGGQAVMKMEQNAVRGELPKLRL